MSMTKCGNLSIGKSIFSIISAARLKKKIQTRQLLRAVERRDETLIYRRGKRQAKFWLSTVRTEFQMTFQKEKNKQAKGKKRHVNTLWTNIDSRDLNKLGPKLRLARNQMFPKLGFW